MRNRILTSLLGTLWATSSWTAEVTAERAYWPTDADVKLVTIRLSGEIVPGDLEQVKKARKKAIKDGYKIVALELDSWGGDGDEGVRLAGWVHYNEATVYVDGYCLSACSFPALVALSQGNLLIDYSAELGVHQVHDTATGEPDPQWTKMTAKVLHKSYGVRSEPLKDMVETPASGMTYFGYDTLLKWGAHTVEKDAALWAWFNQFLE